MVNFIDTIEKFRQNETAKCFELTYGSNGYPSFYGEIRKAFYDFEVETFEEIEEIASKYENAKIITIEWKDGWDLAVGVSNAYDLLEDSIDSSYGENYSQYDPQDSLFYNVIETINEDFNNGGTLIELEKDLENVLSKLKKLNHEYEMADENEIVVVQGIEYVDTIKRKTQRISHLHSNKHTAIAIMFNDQDFK